MVRPLKVSEKGAPLSCDEFDTNIDRLLNRENHTGTQKSVTISDLDESVQAFDFIQEMKGEMDLLSDKLNLFTDDVIRAELANAVNSLRDQLLILINQSDSEIQENEDTVNNIQVSLDSVKNNILAIESAISVIPNILDADNDLYLNLQQLSSNLNTEITNRSIADSSLQIQISDDLVRADVNETNARIANDNQLRAEVGTHITNLVAADTAERDTRVANDNQLRAEIGTHVNNLVGMNTNERNGRIATDDQIRIEYSNDLKNVNNAIINQIRTLNDELRGYFNSQLRAIKKPKAWILFNAQTGAIENVHNVASITKLFEGIWLIIWGIPMNTDKYLVEVTTGEHVGASITPSPVISNVFCNWPESINGNYTRDQMHLRFWTAGTTPTVFNPSYVSVVAYDSGAYI